MTKKIRLMDEEAKTSEPNKSDAPLMDQLQMMFTKKQLMKTKPMTETLGNAKINEGR